MLIWIKRGLSDSLLSQRPGGVVAQPGQNFQSGSLHSHALSLIHFFSVFLSAFYLKEARWSEV